jgi:transporter family-2 protein
MERGRPTPAPFVSGGPAMLGRVVAALATLLAVLAGLAGSVQVAVMARLGERVGVFAALAWAAMLTAGLALALLLVVRQGLGGIADAARQPVWLWSGAAMGLLIVLTITFAGSRIGVAATVAIMIAGQLAMGAVIDRFGLFGVDKVALATPRVVGIALLAAGAALTLKR